MITLINNITLVPGIENETYIKHIKDACVVIKDGLILYAGTNKDKPDFVVDKNIDGHGNICMPGLVNMHTHTPMTYLRGVGSDLVLDDWLNKAIFPLEKQWNEEFIKNATELGCMEMLRFGTTCFNDMYFYTDIMAKTIADNGMRAMLAHGIVDFDASCNDMHEGVVMFEKWNGKCKDRIKFSLAPHAEYTNTEKCLLSIIDEAKKLNANIHVHLSETENEVKGCVSRHGMSPVEYFEKIGLFDVPTIAAHCVWCSDKDVEILKKHNVTIVHNPVSNLKLGSGIAPINKMINAKCNVTIGTDGVASNNNLNLFEELKMMPLLQKGISGDVKAVTPAQALASATINGAKALGFDNLGLLKEGYIADLIILDINNAHMNPINDFDANLIYSLQGSDVVLTMVDGKVLYQNGEFKTIDKNKVIKKANIDAQIMQNEVNKL